MVRDYWADFDSTWWREEISQGRLNRSRIDIFLQYWLTMNLQEEVKAEHVFRVFAEYAAPLMQDAEFSQRLPERAAQGCGHLQGFAQLDKATTAGTFLLPRHRDDGARGDHARISMAPVREPWRPGAQLRLGLEAIESWVIRRTLLRLTTKDVNKFMVALLKTLNGTDPAKFGRKDQTYLSEQTADTRYWPSDERMIEQLPEMKLYGNIRQGRLLVILEAVEEHLRNQSPKYGAVSLPQGWR